MSIGINLIENERNRQIHNEGWTEEHDDKHVNILFEVDNSIVPWLESQRFDIYFPKYNIAIEYNGQQHYIPIDIFGGELSLDDTKKRDELKRQKCKENNCTLFEVKYNYTENDYLNLKNNIYAIINA